MDKRKLEINEENVRLDKFIMNSISDLSRTLIQEYIKEGHVLVNGKIEKASYKIKMNDAIEITIPDNKEMDVLPEDIPLDIVYEDQDVIVVNKPSGMIVHPSAGIYSGTLVNALLYHCKDLSGINGVNRPGIVHRIDKETSGLLMVAKNDKAHKSLSEQLKEHSVTRRYVALVHGVIPHVHGKVNAPIGRDVNDRQKMAVTKNNSKEAITNFTVLERYDDMSLIECRLETGRTHQIRVHMSYIGYPVYGDPKYGKKKDDQSHGQFLHAKKLGFIHPTTGEYLEFECPLPDYRPGRRWGGNRPLLKPGGRSGPSGTDRGQRESGNTHCLHLYGEMRGGSCGYLLPGMRLQHDRVYRTGTGAGRNRATGGTCGARRQRGRDDRPGGAAPGGWRRRGLLFPGAETEAENKSTV